MLLYRDQAIVLRQHKLGEADRIVTLLTRQHGLVRAVGKGVRRTRSKFGARLEPFAYIDVQLYPGRNLDTVTQVHTVEAFAADIVADYGRYTAACAVLETAERLAGEERAPAPRLHTLTAGALRAIAAGQRPHELILDAFLLRAMGFAGWAPALDDCARCATPGPHRAFHVAAGGAVCVHCRPPGSATPSVGVLELMSALNRGDWAGLDVVAESNPAPGQRSDRRPSAMASGTAVADTSADRTHPAARGGRQPGGLSAVSPVRRAAAQPGRSRRPMRPVRRWWG